MDDILKQIFGDKIVDSKFRDFEVLARVDSTNDYYFTVSKAMCNRNAEKYIFITKHIMVNLTNMSQYQSDSSIRSLIYYFMLMVE